MSAARGILATVLRVDTNAFDARFTLRSGLGVTIALLLGFRSGHPLFAVAAAMGAMSTGFASLQGVYRTRAQLMVTMALAMALSTLAGGLAARALPVEILALALWGALYGLVSALGPGASAVALNATIALVIFSNFPMSARDTLEASGFVVFGGLIQTALLVASWPAVRYARERAALAAAFRSLASYARTIDCANPTVPPAAALSIVYDTLADPQPFGRRATFAAFQTLLDELTRIRSTLGHIASADCIAYLPLRDTTGDALEAIADAIARGESLPEGELRDALDTPQSDDLVDALFGQLRAAWRNASIPLGGFAFRYPSMPRFQSSDLSEAFSILRSNLNASAPFGRHAIRVGVALAIIGVLAHVLPVQRGYWMTLTAALVLRPDFTTTYVRGAARIAGTLLGVGLATAIVSLFPFTPHVALALAIVFAVAGYAVFQMNYGLYTISLTAYVVFILSLVGLPEHAAVVERSIATLAGGALAMIAYAMFPTWESPQTRERLRALLVADRAYLDAVLDGRLPASERAAVWAARAAAEMSLERMLAEPAANDDIPRDVALGIMAASQRLGLANLALSSLLSKGEIRADALRPFVAELDRAFERIDARLAGMPSTSVPALRSAYSALHPSGDLRAVLDLVVDALDTLTGLSSSL